MSTYYNHAVCCRIKIPFLRKSQYLLDFSKIEFSQLNSIFDVIRPDEFNIAHDFKFFISTFSRVYVLVLIF